MLIALIATSFMLTPIAYETDEVVAPAWMANIFCTDGSYETIGTRKSIINKSNSGRQYIKITNTQSPDLHSIFVNYRRNLNLYTVDDGFEQFRRAVRDVTLSDYLNIKPDKRISLFEEGVATDSLGQVFRSRSLTNEMVDFINENYATDRMTAKQTMDGLLLIYGRITDPESPPVTPPVPATTGN